MCSFGLCGFVRRILWELLWVDLDLLEIEMSDVSSSRVQLIVTLPVL
jgi:hypothetical protein